MKRGNMQISDPHVATGARRWNDAVEHTITISGVPGSVLNLRLESKEHAAAEHAALLGDEPKLSRTVRRKHTFSTSAQDRMIDELLVDHLHASVSITPMLGYAIVVADDGAATYLIDEDGELAYEVRS